MGKSRLLKTICGFLCPHKGRVIFRDEDITDIDRSQMAGKGIFYIFQDRSIFSLLTVEENLEIGGWIFRKDKERVRKTVEEIYDRFPTLKEKRNTKATFLSGGQQRMVEIG